MSGEAIVEPTKMPPAEETQSLSKNAVKKQRKVELREATKKERKEREKTARKAKKMALREDRARRLAEGLPVDNSAPPAKKRKTSSPWAGRLVIDCQFDELMTDAEIKSLSSQLNYCYSSVRNAALRPNLIVTSFNGKLQQRYETVMHGHHEAWQGVSFTSTGIESLHDPGAPDRASEDVIYLTADSPHVLETLDESKTYVIGGLVDHNRYKNKCLQTAKGLGLPHAALPIAEFVANMPSRKVLTVNQVVDIMLLWLQTNSWGQAFERAIPQRKLNGGKAHRRKRAQPENGANTAEPISDFDHAAVAAIRSQHGS